MCVIFGFPPSETSVTTRTAYLAASTSFYFLGRKAKTWKPLHSSTLHIILILLPNQDFIMSPHVVNEIKKCNKCYLCCHSWHVLNTVLSVRYKPVKSLSFAIRLNLILSWPDHWKRPWCWETLKARGEGDDRGWNGWHHQLDAHEFVQAPGVGDGQGSLAWCSPWGCKESDMTEWLNWTETTY